MRPGHSFPELIDSKEHKIVAKETSQELFPRRSNWPRIHRAIEFTAQIHHFLCATVQKRIGNVSRAKVKVMKDELASKTKWALAIEAVHTSPIVAFPCLKLCVLLCPRDPLTLLPLRLHFPSGMLQQFYHLQMGASD